MPSVSELRQRSNTQQEQAAAPAKKVKTIFDFLSGDPKIEKAIAAVATQFLTPDRFLRLAVNAVKKTPLLMQCDPQTVLGAFMTSAALGLEPNTVLQQAFLIPYKKRVPVRNEKTGRDEWIDTYECQFQIGARGFITLAHRSPHIHSLQSEAIHENDYFEHMLGSESFLKYKKALKDRGELIGSFCFTKLASGVELATVLPLDEIEKIRNRSETYNALVRNVQSADTAKEKEKAEKKLAETPWVMWADDMAAKSATKKHAKQLPLSPGDGLAAAVALDGDDEHIIDMGRMADPDAVRTVMQDGVDALDPDAQQQSYSFPAITDDPSPTLQTMTGRTAAVETVEIRQAATGTEPQQASFDAVSGLTYAQVADKLEKARDVEMLDADADLIREVPDAGQQEELNGIYHRRREELLSPAPSPAPARQRRQMNLE